MTFCNQIKYIRTKSIKHKNDNIGGEVEDLFMKNGYFQTNGEFSAKKSSHQDSYFKNINEFVDHKLQIVVDKIAEKKALKSANDTLRIMLDKQDQDIQGLLKEHQELQKLYDKQLQLYNKNNEQCEKIQDTLAGVREKIEHVRLGEHENIANLREQHNDIKHAHNYNKQQFNLQKNVCNDELKNQKDHVKVLEDESRKAQADLQDYYSKHKY